MAIDLTRYPVLMLDMNGTFMFGQDRFGPLQDYHATYLALGGQRLSAADLSATIGDFVATMSGLYRTPGLYDAFPSVAEVLQLGPDAKSLGPVELALLEAVIAQHERGTVPVAQAQAITRLAQSHDLILMSSIWSRKDIWRSSRLRSFRQTMAASNPAGGSMTLRWLRAGSARPRSPSSGTIPCVTPWHRAIWAWRRYGCAGPAKWSGRMPIGS